MIPDTDSSYRMVKDHTDFEHFIVEAAADGIMVFDEQGVVVFANASAGALLRYDRDDLIGSHVSRFLPVGVADRHEGYRAAYQKAPSPRPMGLGRELQARRSDDTLVDVEISLSPLPDSDEPKVVAVLRDVTDLRKLRDLGAATLAAAERERGRIARELHDDVLQRLAAALLSLRLVDRAERPDPDAVDNLRERIEDVADRLRRLARGLRPKELQDVGLELALRRLVREVGEAGGPRIEFVCDVPDDHVPEFVGLALYRIVQEALWNAHRHSGAELIMVTAGCDGSVATVSVEDDGNGFDVEGARRSDRGLGLKGMLERAAAVRGSLEIHSVTGEGARVVATLPYTHSTDTPEPTKSLEADA